MTSSRRPCARRARLVRPRSARPALRARGPRGTDALRSRDLILTASTSEAYSFLFKLLTDPGDAILTADAVLSAARTSRVARTVALHPFPLGVSSTLGDPRPARRSTRESDRGRESEQPHRLIRGGRRTGSAGRPGLPIISDEVFLDYPLDATGTTFVRDDVLTFTLGGLSKSAGLPHFKLAWIRVSGPGKNEALDALELIADNFLSVSTPVQVALPEILRIAPRIREAITSTHPQQPPQPARDIRERTCAHVLPVEGGWSAVIRVPTMMSDEDLASRCSIAV